MNTNLLQMSQQTVFEISHKEVLDRLIEISKECQNGLIPRNKILNFCKYARDATGISRSVLSSTLKNYGIDLSEEIKRINSFVPNDPRYYIRKFNRSDAEIIVESICQHPDTYKLESKYYEALTGKVVNEGDDRQTFGSICLNQAEQFASTFFDHTGKKFDRKNFHGSVSVDQSNPNLQHKFSDPNSLNPKNWVFYDLDVKGINETYTLKESTNTRIYLHPKLEKVYVVWEELLIKLSKSPIIAKYGYQSKVPNFFYYSHPITIQISNQYDRILFYFGENTRLEAANIICDYIKNHPENFEVCHSLAMPLTNPFGTNKDVAFISDEIPKDKGESYNGLQAEIIDSIIQDFIQQRHVNMTVKEYMTSIRLNKISRSILIEYLTKQYPIVSNRFGFRSNNTAFLQSSIL